MLMFNKWLVKSYNNNLIVLLIKMTILYLIITNYISAIHGYNLSIIQLLDFILKHTPNAKQLAGKIPSEQSNGHSWEAQSLCTWNGGLGGICKSLQKG